MTMMDRRDQPAAGETRVTSATGGQKGAKLARFDLIPAHVEWLLAELFGKGARKYEDRNWERGYDWSLSYAAARRHMSLFWQGEDDDACGPECPDGCEVHMNLPHPVCAIFHMMVLTEFMRTHRDFDDRPSP